MTPALFTSRLTFRSRFITSSANACTVDKSARSIRMTATSACGTSARMRFLAAAPRSTLRTANMTLACRAAKTFAASQPMPLFAPVTIAVIPRKLGMLSIVQSMAALLPSPAVWQITILYYCNPLLTDRLENEHPCIPAQSALQWRLSMQDPERKNCRARLVDHRSRCMRHHLSAPRLRTRFYSRTANDHRAGHEHRRRLLVGL